MLKEFQQHIEQYFPKWKKQSVGVAISGGVDSVVLAYLAVKSGFKITLLHCNFNLRGAASDGDQAYVKRLAEEWNVPFVITEFNTIAYAEVHKTSIQVAARELRYDWFRKMAELHNLDIVATAHHADDNLETFLINLTRGTGLEGLTGIPAVNTIFERPLLPFSKEELLDFAKSVPLQWREDASNETTKYLRNHIRHKVVPNLKEVQPQLLDNFKNTLDYLQQSKAIVDSYVKKQVEELFIADSITGGFKIDVTHLKNTEHLDLVLFESLRPYGFSAWTDIKKLLTAQTGKKVVSNTYVLLKDREKLMLYPKTSTGSDRDASLKIEATDTSFRVTDGVFKIEKGVSVETSSGLNIELDIEKISYPLIVRKWEEGDYFYPVGMQGKKKLSKYFKDEKMPLPQKEQTWLVCSSNNEIIWVVGKRLDRRFAAIPSTKNKITITYYENSPKAT